MTYLLPTIVVPSTQSWAKATKRRKVRPRRVYQRSSMLSGSWGDIPHIVIVDDDQSIATLVCSILEDARISASICLESSKAMAYIKKLKPHAVLLDVQMPGVNGIEVFEQLQRDRETSMIPVIFLSADAQLLDPYLAEYNALGVRLLRKPFTTDELLAIVATVLRMEG